MDNFDQLIKEVVESGKHPFKEKYWTVFAQKAGFTPLLSGAKIILISSAVAVVAGGILAAIYFNKTSQNDSAGQTVLPTDTNTHIIAFNDTITDLIELDDIIEELQPADISEKKSLSKKTSPKIVEDILSPIPSEEKGEDTLAKESKYRWRVLVIDPDTIKSNY